MRANDASTDKTPADKTPTDKTPTDKTWTHNTWTNDRIASLKQMWAEGASAAAIAERLGGLSRSAVLGKIHRLRPSLAKEPSVAKKISVAKKTSVAKKKRAAAKTAHKPTAPEQRGPTRPVAPSPQPQTNESRQRGKSLLELTNDTCRWPHGEPGTRGFFFCGAPGADLEGGKPYCVPHARRAYGSAEIAAAEDESPIVPVRNSPSIAPLDGSRRYVWRAPVNHPAPRGK
jgi:GcrA cell cycle regulator